MALWQKFKAWWKPEPVHLQRGSLGERAAKGFLKENGLKFLTANFAGRRGEIDLVFRDGECLVFVEVKTRSSEAWTRPSRAVDARKRLAIVRTAHDYLGLLGNPAVPYRFDVVEVLLEEGEVREIRHIESAFNSRAADQREVRR
ncbi:MAG TPA: YraN family protein [Verrucomicrobiae bacterium]|nr:YraN family protein [Verrucomicrobiae bacterium]